MDAFRAAAQFAKLGGVFFILRAYRSERSKKLSEQKTAPFVPSIRAVRQPGIDQKQRRPEAGSAPEEVRPDFGLHQDDRFGPDAGQGASDEAASINGIIDLTNMRRQLALQFLHAGGRGGGYDDFEVWQPRL